MGNSQEKEIKLVSTTAGRKRLSALPLFRDKLVPGSQKTLTLVNRYYDTQDRKLTAGGMAYRIRETNGKELEVTVKTQGRTVNGFSERGEYTQPLTKVETRLTGFDARLDQKLATLLKDDELLTLFTVDVIRQVALLQLSAVTIVEIAVDMGTITAGGRTAPIDEIELELKRGQEKELLRYTAALAQEIPLLPEEKSKFRRGMELLGYRGFKDDKAAKLSCSGEDDPIPVWQNLFRQQASFCLDILKEHHDDPEALNAKGFAQALDVCRGIWQLGQPFLSRSSWQKGRTLLSEARDNLMVLERADHALDQAAKSFPDTWFSLQAGRAWLNGQQELGRGEAGAYWQQQAGAVLWQVIYLSCLTRPDDGAATVAGLRQKLWTVWQQEEVLLGENGSRIPEDKEANVLNLVGLMVLEKLVGNKPLYKRTIHYLRQWQRFTDDYRGFTLCVGGTKKAASQEEKLALAAIAGMLGRKFVKDEAKLEEESRQLLKELRKNKQLSCV